MISIEFDGEATTSFDGINFRKVEHVANERKQVAIFDKVGVAQ